MKETLYAIPVNEAFAEESECPLCALRLRYEEASVDSLLSSAYMEPDCRKRTNALGFCGRHCAALYAARNRLGVALMLETHLQSVLSDVEALRAPRAKAVPFFPAGKGASPSARVRARISDCALCRQIGEMEGHYVRTVAHLFRTDAAFARRLSEGKGFCLPHFAALLDAAEEMPASARGAFFEALLGAERRALRRLEGDLRRFADSFDYRQSGPPDGAATASVRLAADKLRGKCCPEE